MKQIKNIVLVTPDGTPQHDVSPDVLTPDELKVMQSGGMLPEGAGVLMDAVYLIQRMIDLYSYETRTEQRRADKVYDKIKAEDGNILVEEADYRRIKTMADKFTPYLTGRTYGPFFNAIESAEDIEVEVLVKSPTTEGHAK